MKKILSSLYILLLVCACKKEDKKIQFYHWKSNAKISVVEKEALKTTKAEKTFIHYFDVVVSEGINQPVSVIQDIDTFFNEIEVVPVVFISNSVFKGNSYGINSLVDKVENLVQQIHQKYFNKKAIEIQIDCDWTKTTKEAYFQFLKLLKKKIQVSTTIRLHQIKYQKETGIPPVDFGALMLYNVGDLSDFNHNSILNSKIVSQYIKNHTNYPLELDLALPLFSQVVIKNKEHNIRLINRVIEKDFKNDTEHFKNIGNHQYLVLKKKLYRGQYLYKDFVLKLEKTSIEEIVKSSEIVKKSNLNIRNTILYHLDETEIKELNFKELITKL
ncbi:hypothetical protein [Tenacibaculum jejuense]|uniref:Lipoprotein n=1 Tax=Tenacibaculum jejuense TaxID=584609 RepID=A0A238UAR3_9FLAO|nr:hypothetical protein [Tenacibaculum jejuense]SNR16259.1 Protein of unknown function precursor [Tenacibaculum jejuense]